MSTLRRSVLACLCALLACSPRESTSRGQATPRAESIEAECTELGFLARALVSDSFGSIAAWSQQDFADTILVAIDSGCTDGAAEIDIAVWGGQAPAGDERRFDLTRRAYLVERQVSEDSVSRGVTARRVIGVIDASDIADRYRALFGDGMLPDSLDVMVAIPSGPRARTGLRLLW